MIEFASRVITRAEARDRAADLARGALEAERENRARLRGEREAFAAVLVPLVLAASAVWIGFLSLTNVRERSPEIGILRALGLPSRGILFIFLARALLMGLLGAMFGYLSGIVVGTAWGDVPLNIQALVDPVLLLLAFLVGPVLSGMACWIPAMMAAGQDPAVVLREM